MKLLDTFCGAGGAGMGYYKAGFDVTGIDIKPQSHYPFKFYQADAFEYVLKHWEEFDVIHASPPCQRYSMMQRIHNNYEKHPDLVEAVREVLVKTHKPYVIENVVGAPLRIDVMLCGTMFNLPIALHRIFESNIVLEIPMKTCNHVNLYDPFHGGEMARGEREKFSIAKGVNWFMTRPEIREAIPPAYTEFIGKQLMKFLCIHSVQQ